MSGELDFGLRLLDIVVLQRTVCAYLLNIDTRCAFEDLRRN